MLKMDGTRVRLTSENVNFMLKEGLSCKEIAARCDVFEDAIEASLVRWLNQGRWPIEGDAAADRALLLRLVDLPHPSLAELLQQAVGTDDRRHLSLALEGGRSLIVSGLALARLVEAQQRLHLLTERSVAAARLVEIRGALAFRPLAGLQEQLLGAAVEIGTQPGRPPCRCRPTVVRQVDVMETIAIVIWYVNLLLMLLLRNDEGRPYRCAMPGGEGRHPPPGQPPGSARSPADSRR